MWYNTLSTTMSFMFLQHLLQLAYHRSIVCFMGIVTLTRILSQLPINNCLDSKPFVTLLLLLSQFLLSLPFLMFNYISVLIDHILHNLYILLLVMPINIFSNSFNSQPLFIQPNLLIIQLLLSSFSFPLSHS